MRRRLTTDSLNKIVDELNELDRFVINMHGKKIKTQSMLSLYPRSTTSSLQYQLPLQPVIEDSGNSRKVYCSG